MPAGPKSIGALKRRLGLAPPPPPPPSRRLRNGLLAAGAAAGGASVLSALAYLQARLVASDGNYVTVPLDGFIEGADGDAKVRIVWLGDSLAAGLGAISPDLTLPRLVAFGRDHNTRLHVFAVPGATSDDVVREQLPILHQLGHGLAQVGQRIDAIGVTVGANDISAFTPRRRFRQNLRRIVRAAEGAPVVLVSIPQLGDAIRLPRPLRTIAATRALWLDLVLRQVAAEDETVFYASVRSRPGWIRRRDLQNFLAADRFHPSGAGYALWADTVIDAFDKALSPAPIT